MLPSTNSRHALPSRGRWVRRRSCWWRTKWVCARSPGAYSRSMATWCSRWGPRTRRSRSRGSTSVPSTCCSPTWCCPGPAARPWPAKLLQLQPLVPCLLERHDVGGIDAVVARLDQFLEVRGRVAQLFHVRDVLPVDAVIPQAHEVLRAQVLVTRAIQ